VKDCKSKFNQNDVQNGENHNNFQENTSNGADRTYCRQPGHTKAIVSN
jgi:hypothetical protein